MSLDKTRQDRAEDGEGKIKGGDYPPAKSLAAHPFLWSLALWPGRETTTMAIGGRNGR